MGIADELEKLEQLRLQGALTSEEFALAKTQLLAPPRLPINAEAASFLEDQLTEVRYQNELARIDREWEIERRQYEIVGRYGRVFTPTIGLGVAAAFGGGIFGLLWTGMAIVIIAASSSFAFDTSLFPIFKIAFPLIGILFTMLSIGRGLYFCLLAQNYNVALQAYKRRHEKVTSSHNRDFPSKGDL